VDWISGVGESLQIASATIHHCVMLMDLYTSLQPNVTNHDLQLIAITCLMISTKFHEMKYPSASSLNSATRNAYTYETIIAKEGEILATINWDLLRYTVLDYVHIFINQGCLFDTDTISSTNQQGKSQITKVIT
jgi:Cyclin, N-terminal domain